jgi:hypothetical protein
MLSHRSLLIAPIAFAAAASIPRAERTDSTQSDVELVTLRTQPMRGYCAYSYLTGWGNCLVAMVSYEQQQNWSWAMLGGGIAFDAPALCWDLLALAATYDPILG